MADYELIQERLISGKGVLRVPADKKKLRHYILYSDVIRMPRSAYLNKNWNPDKGKYAFLTFIRNDYVIAELPIEYKRQSIDGVADISGQTLLAVKCAYEGTLITLSNLGLALGAPPLTYQDLIKDYENLNLVWDEIRVSCYADTALQLRLYRRNYDVCNPDKDDQPPPPPPPPPLPPVPPTTPIADISPPYDQEDNGNDGGNTIPYPGDEVPPPPGTWFKMVTSYIESTNCSIPPSPLEFYFEPGEVPTAAIVPGQVICGAPKWRISRAPTLYIFKGQIVVGVVGVLYEGQSNYVFINEAVPAIDPRQ